MGAHDANYTVPKLSGVPAPSSLVRSWGYWVWVGWISFSLHALVFVAPHVLHRLQGGGTSHIPKVSIPVYVAIPFGDPAGPDANPEPDKASPVQAGDGKTFEANINSDADADALSEAPSEPASDQTDAHRPDGEPRVSRASGAGTASSSPQPSPVIDLEPALDLEPMSPDAQANALTVIPAEQNADAWFVDPQRLQDHIAHRPLGDVASALRSVQCARHVHRPGRGSGAGLGVGQGGVEMGIDDGLGREVLGRDGAWLYADCPDAPTNGDLIAGGPGAVGPWEGETHHAPSIGLNWSAFVRPDLDELIAREGLLEKGCMNGDARSGVANVPADSYVQGSAAAVGTLMGTRTQRRQGPGCD